MAEHPIAARAVPGSNPGVSFFLLLLFPLLWPSGLRRAVKVRISSEAQVRILSAASARGGYTVAMSELVKELDLRSTVWSSHAQVRALLATPPVP